jgi:predicted DCC family thiol-disulfide oxidoreductase YuxK
MSRERPLLIYDGDCRFCTLWVERWRTTAGDRVECRPSQHVAREFPDVPAEAFANSVQLIDRDGRRYERSEAVFRFLAIATLIGRLLLLANRKIPFFAAVCDGAYRFVAAHRMLFSWFTWLLWGRDVTRPTYAISTAVFLRLLGAIYLIAFLSFGIQAKGLVGAHGILPVQEIFPQVAQALGPDAWWQWPTLLWFSPSDGMLSALTWGGALCALLVMAGVAQPLALLGAWGAYLSLIVGGQDFYSFQWDVLLLEAGLLSVFVAPWWSRPNLAAVAPGRLGHFLLVWLLFRLMFSSGVVKLSSGDEVWANLTALDFHYWTQPIPTPLAWFAAQAPPWFQKVSCAGMFAVELGLPFLIFLPRRLRLIACGGFLGLQALIALTGNYGFFNLLAAALAVLLVDDRSWPWLGRPVTPRFLRWPRWILPPLAVAYFLLSLVPLAGAFRSMPTALGPLLEIYEKIGPFRSINNYGLFAVMTRDRPEILLQGSMDGIIWETYEFKYKPGPLDRRPPFVAPYMPRLDWQMWFAALGDVGNSPWMGQLVGRLFQAQPEVLALFAKDPFHGKPPKYLRANLDSYRFTTFAEARPTGDWWKSEPKGIYFPQVSREAFGR